ncbi:hypothetical protein POM88_003801 [Heracleum sosnowskyi]|uniref:Uncharacterized protein n=1 Tax=Heracleum sosnowskyi TaxID=360622 RepID=A0AAD8JIA1_9APIA|nr:hypothetical protein POM88_003801 [Heracleum sosnowskyi]
MYRFLNCLPSLKLCYRCPSLKVLAVSSSPYDINTYEDIDQEVASAIASSFATIKRLVLDKTKLKKVDLELILRGCKELELIYVRDCVGFDEDDEEILALASGIKEFQREGSRTQINNSSGYNEYICDDVYYDIYEDYDVYFDY